MTIQEKKTLDNLVQKNLEDEVTVRQMKTIRNALQSAYAEMETMSRQSVDMESDHYIEAFLQAKTVAGLSEKSIERYAYVLARLLASVQVSAGHVTVDHIRKYFAEELGRGICENSIRGYRDVFCSFFGWLWREGLIPTNPCANLEPIKVPKLQKAPFTAAEVELMKEACTSARDKAIICFLLATGCRIDEVARLNRSDVDLSNKECKVFGKGAKERTVYLDGIAVTMLKRYFATRTDDSPALFVGRGSDRMTTNGIRTMLKRIEKSCCVENIHPHRFRRTLATNLTRYMPVQEVAMILGHEKIDTTMKYVTVEKTSVKHHYQNVVA